MAKVGIAVDNTTDKLIIEFSEPTDHLEFSVQEATDFIKAVIEHTQRVNGKNNSAIILPSGLH